MDTRELHDERALMVMRRDSEAFEVGERVVYTGFKELEYGTVVKVSTEIPKDGPAGDEISVYTIRLDTGGTFTGLSRHLRHVITK